MQYWTTRRYGALRAPPSSSCGGLVAFGHIGGPSGPLPVVPYWCWGGDISKMVSHMGSEAIFQCFVTFVTCDVWCVMCDVTHDMSCDVYYSPMLMLGWWHFRNGVTHGVQDCFQWFVTCVMCDVWCVMCDVTCDVTHVPTCHTWHTWHTVKISAKSVSNWWRNGCFKSYVKFVTHGAAAAAAAGQAPIFALVGWFDLILWRSVTL